ncbi:MAG TPA: NAD-dependent epimerase/dehydratase family protein [Blastocatellia bacterium]|nr:NAD-dependent epimerase/dehydratase family protein [Blastocatellia bacterium]
MQILVIGGTGFIGPRVIEQLASAGHDVAVLHRGRKAATLPAGVRTIRGDRHALQLMKNDLKRLAPDVVIDMICYNETEAADLVQAFSGLARRLVVASSQDVYRAYGCFIRLEEGMPATAPLTEDAPLRATRYPYRQFAERLGQWVYDYDKILVEQLVTSDVQLPCTVLRLPCVYGPHDHQQRTFEYLKRMDDGREAILLDERRAAWRWTRGYVENVAAAIALAATDERAAGRTYNVGDPRAMSELEWARSIAEAADWKGEFVTAPDDALPPHLRTPYDYTHHVESDTGRIRRELDYTEPVARSAAMQQTVTWQRTNSPATISAAAFDYAAEDALLDRLRPSRA